MSEEKKERSPKKDTPPSKPTPPPMRDTIDFEEPPKEIKKNVDCDL